MGFLSFGLKEWCTYWAPAGIDGFGKHSYAAPVNLRCRWEASNEFVRGDDGVAHPTKAKVFLAVDVEHGGYLAYGIVATADPRDVAAASAIVAFKRIPGINAEQFERRALL